MINKTFLTKKDIQLFKRLLEDFQNRVDDEVMFEDPYKRASLIDNLNKKIDNARKNIKDTLKYLTLSKRTRRLK